MGRVLRKEACMDGHAAAPGSGAPGTAVRTYQGTAYALELLFQALHATLGPCRFEGTTFRLPSSLVPVDDGVPAS
jgi:hypothetical protein